MYCATKSLGDMNFSTPFYFYATIISMVCHWPKHYYGVHDCIHFEIFKNYNTECILDLKTYIYILIKEQTIHWLTWLEEDSLTMKTVTNYLYIGNNLLNQAIVYFMNWGIRQVKKTLKNKNPYNQALKVILYSTK